jgi:hypothetical protein
LKILFLTFYYKPDLSAGSFRASSLINELIEQAPKDTYLDVLTTLPNRYKSFSSEAPKKEPNSQIRIKRISIPKHNSKVLDQSRAFIVYGREVLNYCSKQKYDLIFATSSRLMTAALAGYISRKSNTPLYLDLRDIFVDTINDILPKSIAWLLKPIFFKLQTWTVNSSTKINLVSDGFLPYFKKYYPDKNYSFYTNGIDDEFVEEKFLHPTKNNSRVLNVLYAGNIGKGQGLEKIIPRLAKLFENKLYFTVIGYGGRKQKLIENLKVLDCKNVKIITPVKRNELIKFYQISDILFLNLNNYDSFKKVLPSKIFEYGATGKPIWAGVAGYAAEFLKYNISNCFIFKPCDANDAKKVFNKLRIARENREVFLKKYARRNIMKKMAADLLSLCNR